MRVTGSGICRVGYRLSVKCGFACKTQRAEEAA